MGFFPWRRASSCFCRARILSSQIMPSLDVLQKMKDMRVEDVDSLLSNAHDDAPRRSTHKRDWNKASRPHRTFVCNVDKEGNCRFEGPLMESDSRPLQHAFGEGNVLCVHFEQCLKDSYIIHDRYRLLAREGILCGLKKFVFFGFKNLQRKKKQFKSRKSNVEMNVVFICIESRAPADIRNQSFKQYRSITDAREFMMHSTVLTLHKAFARYQLTLSKTIPIPLDFDKIRVIPGPDIFCKDKEGNVVRDPNGKPLIHTDGGGYISKNLAMHLTSTLSSTTVFKGRKLERNNKDEEYPLMMQIRLFHKGSVSKGVLVMNCTLLDDTIYLRDSMIKVKTDENILSPSFDSLELCTTSQKMSNAKSFQNLILLLKMGGVPDHVFLTFVQEALDEIKSVIQNPQAAIEVAMENAESHSCGLLARDMLVAGLMPSTEPYLRKMLWDMMKGCLDNLSKGRAPVPKCKYLIGCADPSGRLECNQVVVMLGRVDREDGPMLRKKVLVYKPPGLHPGDIHVFEATWDEEIQHAFGNSVYGIVFSTKGTRSITDEMANSDLDGDAYWVCWNSKLVDAFMPTSPWQPSSERTPDPPS